MHVVHDDVDLGDLQGGHPLDRADHVAADRLGQLTDLRAVLDDDVQIDSGLPLADLDSDALAHALRLARDLLPDRAERAGRAAAELVHAADLTGRHAGDLFHHNVGDRGLALRGDQRGLGQRLHRGGAVVRVLSGSGVRGGAGRGHQKFSFGTNTLVAVRGMAALRKSGPGAASGALLPPTVRLTRSDTDRGRSSLQPRVTWVIVRTAPVTAAPDAGDYGLPTQTAVGCSGDAR